MQHNFAVFVAVGTMGRDSMGSNLHTASHLSQHAQHASDNHSMSNINVLSLLDPSNHSNLLGKQSNDGAQPHQYDVPDAFLTHGDLLSGRGVSNGMDHHAWNSIAKSGPMQDNGMGAHAPDSHHGPAENGSEKNMQDLLESVQRRNPIDTHGWKVCSSPLAPVPLCMSQSCKTAPPCMHAWTPFWVKTHQLEQKSAAPAAALSSVSAAHNPGSF